MTTKEIRIQQVNNAARALRFYNKKNVSIIFDIEKNQFNDVDGYEDFFGKNMSGKYFVTPLRNYTNVLSYYSFELESSGKNLGAFLNEFYSVIKNVRIYKD